MEQSISINPMKTLCANVLKILNLRNFESKDVKKIFKKFSYASRQWVLYVFKGKLFSTEIGIVLSVKILFAIVLNEPVNLFYFLSTTFTTINQWIKIHKRH